MTNEDPRLNDQNYVVIFDPTLLVVIGVFAAVAIFGLWMFLRLRKKSGN
jgi:hypothetical protein